MKLSSSNNLGELLHVGGFDIDYVEALVLNIEIPEVDTQIVTADEGFTIAVYRYAVDVICVSVRISSSGDGGNNGVMVRKARQLQIRRVPELLGCRESSKAAAATAYRTSGCYIMGKVVLSHHFKRLFENFPQLDRLIIGG